ncbi:MAG TPA: endopeptidase La, partial [Anaerolineae bacterium]|nr:endopeptidase La [Anaerolineae bacterium]
KAKDRILEYIAVRQLAAEKMRSPILCFLGPPGTGKTSLGRSIAEALGRKFVRVSLGGIRDEAEIRGHRRTYVGALPGRIIQTMRRAGAINPVFMLDEIDKLTMDFHGDPASALLEVLDPEQNTEFRDNYLEVAYDLSQVFFITTANTLETIPGPLRDRMEIIFLSGYTESEKIAIATGYLIPRQIRENSLHEDEITFTDDALRKIIREYTRESGVRNLERKIGAVCRKVATHVAEGKLEEAKITQDKVEEYLDHPIFQATEELNQRTSMPGVVPGLAWTPYGGDVLFVEATSMPGGKGFQVTGSIGNVMNESARAALSFVRSRTKQLGLETDFFNKSDIHLHIPSGAQPKDGPSAGVTIATSLVSLISGRKVKPHVGMTGEITLRGQVLPIGGVKEKVLAAHRNGLRTVILPKRNENDLDDVPEEIKKSMKFIFVETVDEVLDAALETNHKRSSPVDKRSSPAGKSAGSKQASKKKTTSRKTQSNGKNTARRR